MRSTGCRDKNETAADWDWSKGTGVKTTGARAAGVKHHWRACSRAGAHLALSTETEISRRRRGKKNYRRENRAQRQRRPTTHSRERKRQNGSAGCLCREGRERAARSGAQNRDSGRIKIAQGPSASTREKKSKRDRRPSRTRPVLTRRTMQEQ
jgi:hypothetical protein